MICTTLREAKARLNMLVSKAEAGEDVVLMRGSHHVAAIVPISDADIELGVRLSDRQADRLWAEIDAQRKAGKLLKLDRAADILT